MVGNLKGNGVKGNSMEKVYIFYINFLKESIFLMMGVQSLEYGRMELGLNGLKIII